jgi:hypothetical protein
MPLTLILVLTLTSVGIMTACRISGVNGDRLEYRTSDDVSSIIGNWSRKTLCGEGLYDFSELSVNVLKVCK